MNDLSGLPNGDLAFGHQNVSQSDLLAGYRKMVIGRRLDQQATNLAKQGYLTVYPSSRGQEACQISAAMALGHTDWLFPTYRDTVAMITHGVHPVEALTMLRGDWHCGFNPLEVRTAPHSTPLATHTSHAVGLAMAARHTGRNAVALVLCGEGSTSEGDFHEALNLAAVFNVPVVFLVQHNGYAISVPSHKQCRAKSIADKAAGYGMLGVSVDGNNFAETFGALRSAVDAARCGEGPTLIEARTYRMAPHTNSDDPSLYRDPAETQAWQAKDPIDQLHASLTELGVLDDAMNDAFAREADDLAAQLRQGVIETPKHDASRLFSNVYATLPPHLAQQQQAVTLQETYS